MCCLGFRSLSWRCSASCGERSRRCRHGRITCRKASGAWGLIGEGAVDAAVHCAGHRPAADRRGRRLAVLTHRGAACDVGRDRVARRAGREAHHRAASPPLGADALISQLTAATRAAPAAVKLFECLVLGVGSGNGGLTDPAGGIVAAEEGMSWLTRRQLLRAPEPPPPRTVRPPSATWCWWAHRVAARRHSSRPFWSPPVYSPDPVRWSTAPPSAIAMRRRSQRSARSGWRWRPCSATGSRST